MSKKPRFDFNFSYWIFIWFLLYWNKYINFNPKIWFILALILNTIELVLMIYYNNNFINIFLFVIINSIIKIYPLFLLRNTPYKIEDFLFGFFIFIIYSIWLFINKTNIYNVLKDIFINIKTNNIGTPMIYYIIKYLKL